MCVDWVIIINRLWIVHLASQHTVLFEIFIPPAEQKGILVLIIIIMCCVKEKQSPKVGQRAESEPVSGLRQRLCCRVSLHKDFLGGYFTREWSSPGLLDHSRLLVGLQSFTGQVQGSSALPPPLGNRSVRKDNIDVKWLVNFHPERWWTVTTRTEENGLRNPTVSLSKKMLTFFV